MAAPPGIDRRKNTGHGRGWSILLGVFVVAAVLSAHFLNVWVACAFGAAALACLLIRQVIAIRMGLSRGRSKDQRREPDNREVTPLSPNLCGSDSLGRTGRRTRRHRRTSRLSGPASDAPDRRTPTSIEQLRRADIPTGDSAQSCATSEERPLADHRPDFEQARKQMQNPYGLCSLLKHIPAIVPKGERVMAIASGKRHLGFRGYRDSNVPSHASRQVSK